MRLMDRVIDLPEDFGTECAVSGCDGGPDELVQLVAFDPIDHGDSFVHLCGDHMYWAEKRNEFAREMHEKLRDRRRDVGRRNMDRIQALQGPADGEINEAVSLGVADDIGSVLLAVANIDRDEVVEP